MPRYFIALMRYIEQNPVRAGMVAGAGDYTWSNLRRYAMGVQDANTAWLVPHAEWAALGDAAFAQWVEQQTNRPAASKGIGRPRSVESIDPTSAQFLT